MNKTVKVIVEVVLLAAIVGLAYALYSSIMKPVNFNKEKAARETVAVQRLKDIRTLQVALKSVTGKFTADADSLKLFYETGKMKINMQIGSNDDSLAVAHTAAIKKKLGKKANNQELFKLYQEGDQNLVFTIEHEIAVKDTLFNNRPDFCVDSLKYIPFSNGEKVIMDATVRQVSGVPVPLFEACMPYKALLKGLDNQLRINLDAERKDQNKYEGLMVGSVTAPNNNAGNWE